MKFPGAYRRHAAMLGILAAAAAAILLLPLTSQAASPSSGTVSDAQPAVSWTGALALATAGACSGPSDSTCDNYKLTVQAPSYAFSVKIVLQPWGDWDLSVFGPDGGLVGSSGNGPNQAEIVTLTNPASGTYTVAAAPFAPAVGPDGNSYTASATLTKTASTSQPPPGTEHITYADYPAPNGLGTDAGEPSIGANLKSGKVMFQAGLQALRVGFDDAFSPGAASWTDASFLTSSVASLDPIGIMDQRTGRWFSSQLSGTTSLAAFTGDDGANWLPSEGGPLNGGVDHQTIGAGPFHAPLTRDPNGTLYADAVYYCSQDLVAALCARSDNGGATFAPAVPIYTDECGGLHGHVKVAPDGTVYVPNKGCGGKQGVVVSEDNGLTWSVRTVPGSTNGAWDPSVGIASDGTVYLGYDDGDGHARVAVSHDRGKTWTNIRDVGLPVGVLGSAFPAAIAGDPNRAAVAFLGTSYGGGGAFGDTPTWPGVWYLYVATTYDGGNTWTTVNATPNDPVQRGTICGGGFNGCANGTRNLLDFMDATVDKAGRVLVGFADGCVNSCVPAGPNSFTALATIARQVNGRRLFSKFDTKAAPAAPFLTGKAIAGTPLSNLLTWQEPDDHGYRITRYNVYRRTASTTYQLLAQVTAPKTQYSDSQLQAGQTYYYKVSAVNAVGESKLSNEVSPKPLPPAPDPCVEPGVQILSDATGDSTGGDPAKDLQWLSIAEPRSLGTGKIEFILKVASLQSVPPDSTWPVVFRTPDGVDRFVRMAADATGAVTFGYGTGTSGAQLVSATPADPASRYTVDGMIRIVVSRSAIGNVARGTNITQFLVRVRTEGGAVALTPDNMPDSLARTGSYTVKGSERCVVPQPDLAISSSDITVSGVEGQASNQVVVAVVHNLGTKDATNVRVAFAVDGNPLGASVTFSRINAGSSARASVIWDTSGQDGQHTVSATADPANAIAESNESNNTGSRTVTVQGSNVG
jgi:hypothetical protein